MEDLKQFCKTPRQLEVISALCDHGSRAKAAKSLGCSDDNVKQILKRVRNIASKAGHSPEHGMTKTVPEGFLVKGTSTLYDSAGQQKMQWVKSSIDDEAQYRIMSELVSSLTEDIPSRVTIERDRCVKNQDLANMYTITDYHIGMLAWGDEGGADWDVKIATKTLKQTFSEMIDRSPDAETAIINQLGDFLHYDSMESVTPTSGHMLDADSRPEKMIQAGIDCLDYLITEALRTHDRVILVCAQGNHDVYSSLFLRNMFKRLYRDNKRLEIIDSALPFYAFKFGDNMLGFHHGHKVKFDSLPALFANEFREMFGTTERTYIHMGHYHHKEIKEAGKTMIEMHRTLAARDAYASYGGYYSERAADVITYHRRNGEHSRLTVYA